MQGTMSMGHLKRRIHSSLRTIMEIIIHNQCPLTLSAGLWINIVLMAEEKPAISISQQLRPAQEQRERRWQWAGVTKLRCWMSLCSLPRGAYFPNQMLPPLSKHIPWLLVQGPPPPQLSPSQPLCPGQQQKEPSPCREFPPWEVLGRVQSD